MARKTKLTPKVQALFCDALSVGATIEIAAGYAGISYRVVFDWFNLAEDEIERMKEPGREPDPARARFVQFLHAVEEAKAEAGVKWLSIIDHAARIDPKWASYMLERRYPDDYVLAHRQEITGPDGGGIQIHGLDSILKRAYGDHDNGDEGTE